MVPYIGITDFMFPRQARIMLELFETLSLGIHHKLMVGVMMSRKTLNGLPTSWSNVFPATDDVAGVFMPHRLAFNTIHYADYEGLDFADNLIRVVAYGGKNLYAIQLDMTWPDPRVIFAMKAVRPDLQFILQVGRSALEEVDDDPFAVVTKLQSYLPSLDFVLLDRSMGQGRPLDADDLRRFIVAIKDQLPALGIAVAGGLGHKSLHLVKTLVTEFPDLSLDAQGKMRLSGKLQDPINWTIAAMYLAQATKMFRIASS